MKKVVTIVGARPQFIKAWPVSRQFKEAGISEFLVHTGQHYDYQMSQVFFDQLKIKSPDVNLEVGSGSHALQTAEILKGVERVLQEQAPDMLLVYGDTNSTLGGALAATKLHIPVAHVEAGLRSFNRRMPEEHNRVLTDHCSDLLFCPTRTAIENLRREGITQGVALTGDVMHDAVQDALPFAQNSSVLKALNLEKNDYAIATVHRAENVDCLENLSNILQGIAALSKRVIFPAHPRVKNKVVSLLNNIPNAGNVLVIDPLGYLDLLQLLSNAFAVLTDSGGIQKEACWLSVPCLTLRQETEWKETVELGMNTIVGSDPENIMRSFESLRGKNKIRGPQPPMRASAEIASLIYAWN